MKSLKFWKAARFDVASYRWKLTERKDRRFLGSGSDTSNTNIYTYNEFGFRGDSYLQSGFKIMNVGGAHTEGIGVSDTETYPHYLSKLFPRNSGNVDLNFGYSGRSNDYIARTILTFTDVVNPDLVCIMYVNPSNREYYTKDGLIEPYAPNPWGYYNEDPTGIKEFEAFKITSNPEDDFINWYKNHLLISNFLAEREIPFVWDGTFLNNDYTDENKFDGDYKCYQSDDDFATPSENKAYANKLYKHLEKVGIIKK